jgi:uncharacterized protein YjbJ (UPF0337 family)
VADQRVTARKEQLGGRAEQALGDLTGDNEKTREGTLDEAKGNLREGADKARDTAHDATE